MKRYKLRIYAADGQNKGDCIREEFFDTCEAMCKKYREMFVKYSAYNPMAWVYLDGANLWGLDNWQRLPGF